MGQVQNALLGAAGAVASAGLVAKKAVGQKKTEAEKAASNSPSAIAAKKAKASLTEHREAKKRSKKPKGTFVNTIRNAPIKL